MFSNYTAVLELHSVDFVELKFILRSAKNSVAIFFHINPYY